MLIAPWQTEYFILYVSDRSLTRSTENNTPLIQEPQGLPKSEDRTRSVQSRSDPNENSVIPPNSSQENLIEKMKFAPHLDDTFGTGFANAPGSFFNGCISSAL